MFSVTALGHQGWLISTGRTTILVDPVLRPRFSRMPTSGAAIYPPRSLDLSAFPPIDAVLISHEHPDHLDFASLALLDRRTPVYLSAHSSEAARRVATSIGLEVRSLDPGVEIAIGDLTGLPFAPPVVGESGNNEIDVVPLLIRDRAGDGSFFTAVDLPVRRDWAIEVRRHLDRPGVWAEANSGFDRSLHFGWVTRDSQALANAARQMSERYASLFAGWGHPEIVMVTDNGLTLGNDLAPLNAHVFEVDNDALIEALRNVLPGHEFRAALPGTTAELVAGELVAVRERQPFLAPLDRTLWPARGGAPFTGAALIDFAPGTGRKSIEPRDRECLERALDRFGAFLFGRATFTGLYRLAANRDHPFGVRPTVALVLRDGENGEASVFEYRPRASKFVRVDCEKPSQVYVAGIELWASDLLAVLTFEIAADDLFHFSRKRLWNAAPLAFRCDLDTEIELFAHAIRMPEEVEPLYRRSLAGAESAALRFGGAAVPMDPPARPVRRPVLRPMPNRLENSANSIASRVDAAVDAAPIVPAEDEARLAAAVSKATAGTWTLANLTRGPAGELRLTLTIRGEDTMSLDIAEVNAMPRHYRRIGELAFSYGPAGVGPARLRILDLVIVAIADSLTKAANRSARLASD